MSGASTPHSIREQWEREVKPLIGRQGDGVGLGVAIITTDFQDALDGLIKQLQAMQEERDADDRPHLLPRTTLWERVRTAEEQLEAAQNERDGYQRQSQDQAEEAAKWRVLAEADRKAAVEAGERAIRFEDALMLAACEVVGNVVGIEEQQTLLDRWLRDSNPAKAPLDDMDPNIIGNQIPAKEPSA